MYKELSLKQQHILVVKRSYVYNVVPRCEFVDAVEHFEKSGRTYPDYILNKIKEIEAADEKTLPEIALATLI